MKLPRVDYNAFSPALTEWNNTAIQLGLEHGVYIEVIIEFEHAPGAPTRLSENLTRVYFKAMGHEFESKAALRKGLRNKAFA